MRTTRSQKTGFEISRLGLGTAEIGFSYGIGARPLCSEAEAITLLKQAVELGITFFDTANYYGLAEERIGKSGILKDPRVIVETKCAQFLEKGEVYSGSELEKKIRDQVEDSLTKLNVEALPILMLHGPSKQQIEQGELIEIVKKLKQEGKVRATGVSTRGEEAPLAAIASDFFDVIQVAYSILDQRMSTNVLPAATDKHVDVVNRSVLLKGVLTPLRQILPPGLEPLSEHADKAEAIAQSLGINLPELALRFALAEPTIATSLIGTNKPANLEKAVAAANAEPLPNDIVEQLTALAISDPQQVDPARWPALPTS
jgi:aryl-alcohol dehydrogenase-like predicted oxidoreductase